jgi:hypothetical protein
MALVRSRWRAGSRPVRIALRCAVQIAAHVERATKLAGLADAVRRWRPLPLQPSQTPGPIAGWRQRHDYQIGCAHYLGADFIERTGGQSKMIRS